MLDLVLPWAVGGREARGVVVFLGVFGFGVDLVWTVMGLAANGVVWGERVVRMGILKPYA